LGLALDELKEDEKTQQIGEFEVIVEKPAQPFAADQILDYVSSRQGEGFVLKSKTRSNCC
jgi:Fe-S cluster assembly iron-binding protein IscA